MGPSPIAATLLNLRTALWMKKVNARDILFALLYIPAEIYMWIRLGHFVRAWTKFLSRKRVDNWAAQAKAERGSGSAYLIPMVLVGAIIVAMVVIWMMLSPMIQSAILWAAWPVLGVITVLQTLGMFFKLLRRTHGYKV
ncbi:hypothetical protein ACDF64_10130 [Agromyces sp. MMS24-JH15]|uniref:hypothetical protein n=1 Tax=Agromyces sp. MMS24-JH15 TaxID=3243765 RepID=UPI003748DF5C